MFLPDQLETAVVQSSGFKQRFGSLASHPYNREQPTETVWWLFPRVTSGKGNWPAYHLGKYFFDRVSARRVMRTGLHIEKGIGIAASKSDSAKERGFTMNDGWAWHGFVRDLANGEVVRALDELAARAGQYPEITVQTSSAIDRPQIHEKFGRHRFDVLPGGALRLADRQYVPRKLEGVGTVSTVAALGARLMQATAEEPWTWVNLFVGAAVPFHEDPPPASGPAWTGGDFWEKVLAPLAGWIR
jgi:hypothetical protein